MKFVNDIPNVPDEEMEALIKEVELEEQRQDQLGIEETKQTEKPKSKDAWVEKTVRTLVNLRKEPNVKSESLDVIRGGYIIKVSSSFSHPEFEKVKYKNKDGYVKKEYVRDL